MSLTEAHRPRSGSKHNDALPDSIGSTSAWGLRTVVHPHVVLLDSMLAPIMVWYQFGHFIQPDVLSKG